MFIDIDKIPDKSYVVRGYTDLNSLDYVGICNVEPRSEKGEYEICKWLVKSDKMKNYLPCAIEEIRKVLNPKKLTGTFEKRKYKMYKRYFARNGYDIPIIREFKKTYNNIVGEFYYIEIVKIQQGS